MYTLKTLILAKGLNGLSITNTENVIFDNMLICKEAGVAIVAGK